MAEIKPDLQHGEEWLRENRIDDPQERYSYQKRYIEAFNGLFAGYPYYIITHGFGRWMIGADKETGLPIFCIGDVVTDPVGEKGSEHGMKAFIKQYGLPWNSRLKFINELADIENYFKQRSQTESPVSLKLGEPSQAGPEPGVTIQLIELPPPIGSRALAPYIRLNSQCLYRQFTRAELMEIAMIQGPHLPLVKREGIPEPPFLSPGTVDVWLGDYSWAKQILFYWGAPGSGLCFFQFDRPTETSNPDLPRMDYAAFDLNLGEFIPSYVPGLSKPRW